MIETFTNREKRTVAAKISDCQFDAVNKIIKNYPWVASVLMICEDDEEKIEYVFEFLHLNDALMSDSYVRKAKCHEKDKFDDKIGRDLAMKRVVAAHHDALDRAVKRWENKMLVPKNPGVLKTIPFEIA